MTYIKTPLGASNPLLDPIVDRVENVVRSQVDRALDIAGDRATRYLSSSDGQKLMDKFGGKVEIALVDVAYKRRWELALAAVGFAAFTAAGVSVGGKLGASGAKAAGLIGVIAVLPLLLGTPAPVRKA